MPKWNNCRTDLLPNEVGDRILVLWEYEDHWNAPHRTMSICELTERGWRDEEGRISCPEEECVLWAGEKDLTRVLNEIGEREKC